jgi:hypothetical protein
MYDDTQYAAESLSTAYQSDVIQESTGGVTLAENLPGAALLAEPQVSLVTFTVCHHTYPHPHNPTPSA